MLVESVGPPHERFAFSIVSVLMGFGSWVWDAHSFICGVYVSFFFFFFFFEGSEGKY